MIGDIYSWCGVEGPKEGTSPIEPIEPEVTIPDSKMWDCYRTSIVRLTVSTSGEHILANFCSAYRSKYRSSRPGTLRYLINNEEDRTGDHSSSYAYDVDFKENRFNQSFLIGRVGEVKSLKLSTYIALPYDTEAQEFAEATNLGLSRALFVFLDTRTGLSADDVTGFEEYGDRVVVITYTGA